jgi:hypothetical protein
MYIRIGGIVETRKDTVSFSSCYNTVDSTYDMNSLQVDDMMYEIEM